MAVRAPYADRIEDIMEKSRLRHSDVARAVGAQRRSVARWLSGESRPRARARDRLLELWAVVRELAKVLPPDEVEAWLLTPNPLLDHERPLDLLAGRRYKDVLAAIKGMEDGVSV